MNNATTPAKTMTFKSEQAAKVAYKKAEKAAMQTRNASAFVDQTVNAELPWDGTEERAAAREAFTKAVIAADVAAWERARCIYDAARAQGFWIKSYHFGYNPTRDLIAANID